MALANINVPSVNKAAHVNFMGATSISGGKAGLVPAPAAGEEDYFLRGDGTWANGSVDLPTVPVYTAGYGLSLADNEFSVTLQGDNTTFEDGVIENTNKFFVPREELQDRYAQAPFDNTNIVGLDLSHFVDGVNFELDTENLTDGQVTRIRSGSASYNVNNGISRGYVEVVTYGRCQVVVVYSISSQSSYDYGGCIVTEDAPNTEFTYADLKSSTVNKFFYKSGSYANQTAMYMLDANKTYYLNFGYAKNASTNSNDDRFYIHSIRVNSLDVEGVDATTVFTGANATLAGKGGIVPAPLVANRSQFLRGDGMWATPTNTTYSAVTTTANGLMRANDKLKLDCLVIHADKYARSPFDSANIVGLDLSHLVDGTNFEYETETNGTVKIRNGSASYHVSSGISRGYVEVTTTQYCVVKVTYSITSEGTHDVGGCIVTENAPNTTFSKSDLNVANFFHCSGVMSKQTAMYVLDANKTYYLNFAYMKDSSVDTDYDRFSIYEISINSSGGFGASVNENINKFFSPRVELQDRYARAPFDEANVVGLNLSHLIDGENFELDTENLTDDAVTRIRSSSASYNVANGISRGYVEVKTLCKCTVTVTYSISSQSSYDYGGCIVTEGAPNTTFTRENLTSANFFYRSGNYVNQTATYKLAKNKTYYLNFGYAKNASTNSNDDRFYIHSITVEPDCVADNEAEHFFSVASDFQDAVISGIGGKFLPSVSSMTEVLDNSANFQYMTNKYQLLINYPQPNILPDRSETFLGGATTLSCGFDSPKNLIHSSLSDQTIILASDTSTMTYSYGIVKLTETAGFLTYEYYNNSTGTDGARNVIPFNVAATGQVSLGSNTTIQAAAASGYASSWHMIPAIYDPHHILFLTNTASASGNACKYTTIWFNGLTGAPTRTKTLTDIGSWYYDGAGKTNTFDYARPFGVSVEQYTYNSSGDQTKELRYLLLHHGINKAVPVQYTYYTQTGDNVTIDKLSCDYDDSRIFFSKSRGNCYVLETTMKWPSSLLKCTPAQIDNAIKVFKINFATPEIYETNLKVSDIINDIF